MEYSFPVNHKSRMQTGIKLILLIREKYKSIDEITDPLIVNTSATVYLHSLLPIFTHRH